MQLRYSTLLLLSISFIHFSSAWGQSRDTLKNLIRNGDFEAGNRDFSSHFRYNRSGLDHGEYSVTRNAAALNNDLKNPDKGDHTSGNGYYLVANSDGRPGRKIWCGKAFVIPNSIYRISAYFCNLYKHRPSYGFTIGGFQVGGVPEGNDPEVRITIHNKQVGETDKDKFQMFRWLHTSAEWYSGKDSGYVEVCLENVNLTAEGNDLAFDDIGFFYIKTMPQGYEPYINPTIMNEAYMEKLAAGNKPDPRRTIAFADLTRGDSIAPGIYTIHPRKKEAGKLKEGQKISLPNLIFEQSNFSLLPEAQAELEKLAAWMKNNPRIKIRLEGHTDNIGDPAMNVKLSEDRVMKAKEYLVELGIDPARIETIGYGGAHPAEDNLNEETRKLNRRIEFVIIETQ